MLHRDIRLGLSLVPLLALMACGGTPSATDGPSAPTNVAAVAEPEAITVSWDHDGEDVTGFVVDREVAVDATTMGNASMDLERVAIVGGLDAEARSFRDDTVQQGVSYRYAVAALGTGGAVSTSATQSGSPVQPQPPVVMTCDDPADEPIVDAVLAEGIRQTLGIASGPTCADLEDLTYLHLAWPAGDQITSLEGLEHARYLRDLGLDANAISSIEPLANLGSLRWLGLGGNPIADASPLATLTRLRGLAIWDTDITSLDALADLVYLEQLYAGGLGISDLGPLTGMSELRELHLQEAVVSDLDFVTNHPHLVALDVSDTQIDDGAIAVLETLTQLEDLGINGTDITDVSFLDGYTSLHTLRVCCLELDDLTPITSRTDLRTLDVASLGIDDLSFLVPFADLEFFSAWGNEITDVSVLQDKDLDFVNLNSNLLTDLSPLVANASLDADATVDVQYNCLDLTPGSAAMLDIQELLDRGVELSYELQKDSC